MWAENPFPAGHSGNPQSQGETRLFPEHPPQKCLAKKGLFEPSFPQIGCGQLWGENLGWTPPFFQGFPLPCAWRPPGPENPFEA